MGVNRDIKPEHSMAGTGREIASSALELFDTVEPYLEPMPFVDDGSTRNISLRPALPVALIEPYAERT